MHATTHRRLSTLSIALALAGTAFLTGCYQPGGPVYSGSAPLTWISTVHKPKTVSLIDTRTGETLWSVDVPPNKQLVVNFQEDRNKIDVETIDEYMPALMNWEIMRSHRLFGELNNVMPAPPQWARRIEMTLRPQPEMAEASMSLTSEEMTPDDD